MRKLTGVRWGRLSARRIRGCRPVTGGYYFYCKPRGEIKRRLMVWVDLEMRLTTRCGKLPPVRTPVDLTSRTAIVNLIYLAWLQAEAGR